VPYHTYHCCCCCLRELHQKNLVIHSLQTALHNMMQDAEVKAKGWTRQEHQVYQGHQAQVDTLKGRLFKCDADLASAHAELLQAQVRAYTATLAQGATSTCQLTGCYIGSECEIHVKRGVLVIHSFTHSK
jgi:hypothetical protein